MLLACMAEKYTSMSIVTAILPAPCIHGSTEREGGLCIKDQQLGTVHRFHEELQQYTAHAAKFAQHARGASAPVRWVLDLKPFRSAAQATVKHAACSQITASASTSPSVCSPPRKGFTRGLCSNKNQRTL
jgi:hypothetical protein